MKFKLFLLLLTAFSQSVYGLGSRSTDSDLGESLYKDNYLLFLSSRSDIKFQFSFKVKLFSSIKSEHVFDKLYFGYTQKSVWDIFEESKPFEDHNFNPEFFWCSGGLACSNRFNAGESSAYEWRAGVEHESNGLDGNDSRSWNRVYYRPVFTVGDGNFVVAPKIWGVLSKGDENPDIEDYLGYFDLELLYSSTKDTNTKNSFDGFNVGTTIRHGSKEGSILVDASFPLNNLFKVFGATGYEFNPNLYIQYFGGYGENLLNYNQKRNVIRVGFRFYE